MLEYLHYSLKRIQHTYSNSAAIIAGDFNKLNSKLVSRFIGTLCSTNIVTTFWSVRPQNNN